MAEQVNHPTHNTKNQNNKTSKIEKPSFMTWNYTILLIGGLLHTGMISVILYIALGPTLSLENKVYPSREYQTNIYSWMMVKRNDKGEYYAHIVVFHAICAYIAYGALFIPLYYLIKHKKNYFWHKLTTIIVYIFVFSAILLEGIYLHNRGFLVCQFKYYSFNLFVTLQFIPWVFWYIELICYSNISYTLNAQMINGLSKYIKYFLLILSVTSIVICLCRLPVLIIILSDPKTMSECLTPYEVFVAAAGDCVDLLGIYWSYYNIEFIQKALKNKVNEIDYKIVYDQSYIIIFALTSFIYCAIMQFVNKVFLYVPLVGGLALAFKYIQNAHRKNKST